jgi:DNA-directed RNA polymerase subunit RPC12/RpoP
MEYKCQKCNKVFKNNSNLQYHLTKKKLPCDKIITNDGIKCQYCNLILSHSRSLNSHLLVCKELKKLNPTFNINNNININIYGKENLDYITEDTWRSILKSGYDSLIKLVETINFNEDHPENMNLHFINMNNKHSIFYKAKDNLWICVPFEEFMTDRYFMEKKDMMEDKAEEMGIKSKRLKEVGDRIDKGTDSYWIKFMLEKVQHLLYTWTDKVKENRAKEEKRKKKEAKNKS